MSKIELPEISNLAMATLMFRLPAHLPLSDEYEARDPQPDDHWWESQREHLIEWFFSRTCKGGMYKGGYTVDKPELSAKRTYGNLNNPAALIWLADALGVDPALIRQAMDDSLQLLREHKRPNTRSAKIRNILTWELLAEKIVELIEFYSIRVSPGVFAKETITYKGSYNE
ncbi:hypothetical protein SAMN04489737_1004 [Arcanobacterium phocae]|uniref:Uncharacterized protein n=1 Tax=Arcanobacterium phocae TaxID=131112 RepID=A0A1H2LGE3_9ACTO|nr:hypothetical protein [Arcanobacterium phocae]SDU79805.1 hypothetical protein SAMN04489737_1004 [Arcanobacterium phocae]